MTRRRDVSPQAGQRAARSAAARADYKAALAIEQQGIEASGWAGFEGAFFEADADWQTGQHAAAETADDAVAYAEAEALLTLKETEKVADAALDADYLAAQSIADEAQRYEAIAEAEGAARTRRRAAAEEYQASRARLRRKWEAARDEAQEATDARSTAAFEVAKARYEATRTPEMDEVEHAAKHLRSIAWVRWQQALRDERRYRLPNWLPLPAWLRGPDEGAYYDKVYEAAVVAYNTAKAAERAAGRED